MNDSEHIELIERFGNESTWMVITQDKRDYSAVVEDGLTYNDAVQRASVIASYTDNIIYIALTCSKGDAVPPDKPARATRVFQKELRAQGKQRCPLCGEVKPLSEFYEVPSYPGGHSPLCKSPCSSLDGRVRQHRRQLRNQGPEKFAARIAQYRRLADAMQKILNESRHGIAVDGTDL